MKSNVPVVMGSSAGRTIELPLSLVTEAWFPPGSVLEPHTHGRAIFAIMLHGSFRTRIGQRTLDCVPNAAWTEPLEEKHANYVGKQGAHVLVFQPDHMQPEVFAPVDKFLSEVQLLPNAIFRSQIQRIVTELKAPDAWTELHIESVLLSALATAARTLTLEKSRKTPDWLKKARDFIEANFDKNGFSLRTVANAVGMNAAHLATTFRARYGVTPGDYARNLRFDTALKRLIETDASVSSIALTTGYADQSHLTRDFKARIGTTPGAVRAESARQRKPARDHQ